MLLNQQHFSCKPVPRSVGQNLPSSRFPISRSHKKETLIQLQQEKKHPNSWPSLTTVHVCLQSHVRLGHLFHIDVVVHGERMEARKRISLDSGTKAPDPRCSQSLRRTPRTYACFRVFKHVHTPHKPFPWVPFSHLSTAGVQTSGQERTSGIEMGDRWDKGNLGWNRFCSYGGAIQMFNALARLPQTRTYVIAIFRNPYLRRKPPLSTFIIY